MKALIVNKPHNGLIAGQIIQLCVEAPNNHLVNEGYVVALPIPEGILPAFAKVEIESAPDRWVKGEQVAYQKPMIENQVGQAVPDESYSFLPAFSSMTIVEDVDKKEAYLLAVEENRYVKRIEYAKNIIGKVSYLNSKKSLTLSQVAQLSNTYAPIKGLLETGSYPTALSLIAGIVPDGIITEEDKTLISDMIQTYLDSEG